MRLFLFLSRVAFVCNLFFIVAALVMWNDFIPEKTVVSIIAIIGYFLAVFVFNPLVNLSYLLFLIVRKRLPALIPRWLAWANFIFLIVQVIFILLLNDVLPA